MSIKKIKKTEKEKKADLDPTNDEFIDKTRTVFDWAYDHRRPLGLLIIIALVVAVGGIIFSKITDDRLAKESLLVADGLDAAFAVLKADVDPEEQSTKDILTFDDANSRAKEALERWNKLIEQGEPRFKNIGYLSKGAALLELGQNEDAVKVYEQFFAEGAKAPVWLKAQAQEGLGYALEAAGKLDEAKSRFETWMGESEGEYKTLATYHVARLSQKTGDTEAAKKFFGDVLAGYKENTPGRYDVLFVQARARLLSIDPNAKVPDLPAGDMGAFEGIDPRILQQIMQAKSGAGAS